MFSKMLLFHFEYQSKYSHTKMLFTILIISSTILNNFQLSSSVELLKQANNKTIINMSSLDNLVKDEIIKDVIDTKPSAIIDINYNSNVKVLMGNELKPTQVKDMPKFNFEAENDKFYTLAMVDPDAPSRKEPKFREILHFLVSNIPGNQVEKGQTLAEYIGSGPPQGTGLHRYIFLLYKQKDGHIKSDLKIKKTSRVGRVNFSIRNFAKQHNLGEPLAANYYQAQYDDYVPILHKQLSQG